jgi:DNA-binding transcriptional MerR regulator
MKLKRPDGVTLREAAQLLSTLERRPVSPAQVRSILVLDTTGHALAPRQHGDVRLYSAVDVAFVRLTLRLRAEGVSPTVARTIVSCLGPMLAEHLTHNHPMALAVVGLRGLLLYAPAGRPDAVVAWVTLQDVWRGIEDRIRVVRQRAPELRRWNQPLAAVAGGQGL